MSEYAAKREPEQIAAARESGHLAWPASAWKWTWPELLAGRASTSREPSELIPDVMV